ncbi:hypothetical protein [Spirosoma arcticum]
MTPARIRLAFRQVIDSHTVHTDFEKAVFADSYHEFRVQIQSYNADNQFTAWQQVRAAVPSSDPTLSIRVGFAVGLYVGELNGQIPGLIDALGQPVAFTEHQFALLDSDITDRTKHRVALTYLTATLTWLGTVGHYLLLAADDGRNATDGVDTFMVAMQENLSIVSYSAA